MTRKIFLAAPRGFCAGVDRAIKIVEMALEKWGAPVYVRHEIVHNKFVVDNLRDKGAVFVEELDECPNDRPVIFSAHGVPKSVPAEAENRNMIFVDATCPLVSKVHIEAERHSGNGLQMVMIGHKGHPETIGTMGQLPEGEVLLVETVEDVADLDVRDPDSLAYVTQTTLSIDDTADIVTALQNRFPKIVGPHKEDICYATTNRQMAVKAIAVRLMHFLWWARRIPQILNAWSKSAQKQAANTHNWFNGPMTLIGTRLAICKTSGSQRVHLRPRFW